MHESPREQKMLSNCICAYDIQKIINTMYKNYINEEILLLGHSGVAKAANDHESINQPKHNISLSIFKNNFLFINSLQVYSFIFNIQTFHPLRNKTYIHILHAGFKKKLTG